MGRFVPDDDKSNPHDNSDIMRCKTEANEIKVKLQAVKDKLAEHEDSLFYENSGKRRTGLGCHHNFKSVKSHEIKSALRRMLITLLEIWTGYLPSTGLPIRLVRNLNQQKPEKKKEQKKKGNKRRITASDNRGKRACVIFRSMEGTPLENDYEPEVYGILQLQSIEGETLLLICSPQNGQSLFA